ncbi:hypothetical protein FA09DRAFT_199121 [Tilletiopsis washingtonensis]|uniref:Uncharacterized protein n=1 Tax=Tilletiopsis washingtonensis TaxID=58919 RepID=A0A316ZG83_9BASI|nr:hypothetical protein FA09DRAFT_199121 [Tilletiopsis washingtonensis]PWN99932.1 hypothetical protein FA09DRAFT_199121 [Tilletiopsis washingtonensis]
MTIAMVGRFVVASSKLCKEEGKDLFKLQLDWDDAPGNFWLAGATQGEPGWAPASSSGALTRLAPLRGPPVFIDPPTVQSQGAFGSPVPMLCSAVRCLRCGEIIVRRHWKGWRCERCNIDHKALPLLVARDVDFGRMRIDYSGPRMDNGRAMWQSGVGVQRTLQVWSDHVKIPRYDIALAAQDGDASKPNTRVWHLLSSGDVKEKASSLLRKLLKERVPYRRHLFDGVLSPFFTAAFHGSASTRTENFLRVPYTPLDEVRGIFLDTVFAVDELAGRALCPEEERRLPHNEAAFLVISGMSQDVPLHSCVGSIAQSVELRQRSRPDPLAPSVRDARAAGTSRHQPRRRARRRGVLRRCAAAGSGGLRVDAQEQGAGRDCHLWSHRALELRAECSSILSRSSGK